MSEFTVKNKEPLPFDVVVVPYSNINQVLDNSHASTDAASRPVNIKIKVKNNEKLANGLGVTIPKFSTAESRKVNLVSSDQTIISFDLFMETENEKRVSKKKHYNFLKLFKPGRCFSNQNNDDVYPYLPSSSTKTHKAKSTTYVNDLQEDGIQFEETFALKKNLDSTNSTLRTPIFLGKCKPGGCLDPPCGEDKYMYKPKSRKQCVISDHKTSDIKDFDEKYFKNEKSTPAVDKRDRTLVDPLNGILVEKTYSHSLITYPPALSSTDTCAKDIQNIKSKLKTSPVNKSRKSRKSVNDFSEIYFMPPKKHKSKNSEQISIKLSEITNIRHESTHSFTSQEESMPLIKSDPSKQTVEPETMYDQINDEDKSSIWSLNGEVENEIKSSSYIEADIIAFKEHDIYDIEMNTHNPIDASEINDNVSVAMSVIHYRKPIEKKSELNKQPRLSKIECKSSETVSNIRIQSKSIDTQESQKQSVMKTLAENELVIFNFVENTDEIKNIIREVPDKYISTNSNTEVLDHLQAKDNLSQAPIIQSDHQLKQSESQNTRISVKELSIQNKTDTQQTDLQQEKTVESSKVGTEIFKEKIDPCILFVKEDSVKRGNKSKDQDSMMLSELIEDKSFDNKPIRISNGGYIKNKIDANIYGSDNELSSIDTNDFVSENISYRTEAKQLLMTPENIISALRTQETNSINSPHSLYLSPPQVLPETTRSSLHMQESYANNTPDNDNDYQNENILETQQIIKLVYSPSPSVPQILPEKSSLTSFNQKKVNSFVNYENEKPSQQIIKLTPSTSPSIPLILTEKTSSTSQNPKKDSSVKDFVNYENEDISASQQIVKLISSSHPSIFLLPEKKISTSQKHKEDSSDKDFAYYQNEHILETQQMIKLTSSISLAIPPVLPEKTSSTYPNQKKDSSVKNFVNYENENILSFQQIMKSTSCPSASIPLVLPEKISSTSQKKDMTVKDFANYENENILISQQILEQAPSPVLASPQILPKKTNLTNEKDTHSKALSENMNSTFQIPTKKDAVNIDPFIYESKKRLSPIQILEMTSNLLDENIQPADNSYTAAVTAQDLMNMTPVEIKNLINIDIDENRRASITGIFTNDSDKNSQIIQQHETIDSKLFSIISDSEIKKRGTLDTDTSLCEKVDEIISKTITDQELLGSSITENYPASVKNILAKDVEEQSVIQNRNSLIEINLGFHAYVNDKNETYIKTFDTSEDLKTDPQSNITIIKSLIRKGNSEIKIPLTSEIDITLQLKDAIDKDPNISKRDLVITKKSRDSALKKSLDKDILLQQTLDSVYDNLSSVEYIIRKLKEEADFLSNQQALLREILNTMNKSVRKMNMKQKCICNNFLLE